MSNTSPHRTQSSQRIFKIFFLGDLCALCGELLCFFFLIRLAVFLASGGALMKHHFKKLELVLSCVPLHFVGWVEPSPGFVGFRCTQSNLHITGIIAKCETQQRPISEPSPKSFFSDQTGRLRPAAALV